MKIVISGATGFIGKNLLNLLEKRTDFELIALSRKVDPDLDRENKGRIIWRRCNGFSLLDTDRATEGADILIYLIHSMLPTAKLTQGTFEDFDVIVADNFARSCSHNKIRQIIYLGGVIPSEKLSKHLESRLEVESALRSYGNNLTTLRASLVIGPQGSSFSILEKLVARLPLMICPAWTQSKCQPIHLDHLLDNLLTCVNNPEDFQQTYDVGGDEIITYEEMLKITSQVMNKKRYFIRFPYFSPGLSKLWVSKITGAAKNLVYPLVESLKHNMVVNSTMQLNRVRAQLSLKNTLATSLNYHREKTNLRSSTNQPVKLMSVTSVQRLPIVIGRDAAWIAQEYMKWLPKFLNPIMQVTVSHKEVQFKLFGFFILLELTLSPERSDNMRQLFYVTGGILHKDSTLNSRLEFRQLNHLNCVIVALHDYRPSLPWFIYKYTQALLHLFVMKSFGKHLSRYNK